MALKLKDGKTEVKLGDVIAGRDASNNLVIGSVIHIHEGNKTITVSPPTVANSITALAEKSLLLKDAVPEVEQKPEAKHKDGTVRFQQ